MFTATLKDKSNKLQVSEFCAYADISLFFHTCKRCDTETFVNKKHFSYHLLNQRCFLFSLIT